MDPAVQPNTTLYINNLNDRINKQELRTQLYALFATHGKVIDVVATKSPKMRGQAFLVFADLAGATAAMRACAGMTFYDKPLVRDCQPISAVFQVDPTRFPLSFPIPHLLLWSVDLDLSDLILRGSRGIWNDSGYHTPRLNLTRLRRGKIQTSFLPTPPTQVHSPSLTLNLRVGYLYPRNDRGMMMVLLDVRQRGRSSRIVMRRWSSRMTMTNPPPLPRASHDFPGIKSFHYSAL